MTARKIRMTSVGLIAMPADRNEAHVSVDDMGDPELRTAFAELDGLFDDVLDEARRECDEATCSALETAWNDALAAALNNDAAGTRRALLRAVAVAATGGFQHPDEDAALAMLPGDAS